MNNLSDIHVFIISWEGKHENSLAIASQINKITKKVSIVYSDPNEALNLKTDFNTLKRPNNLYWGDKFQTCITNCSSENLLIIHGDCQCSNWSRLIKKYDAAIKKFNDLGVWSPKVNGTRWSTKLTSIFSINDSNYEIVSFIDGIVFGLSKQIQERMRAANYENNIYGWGIGWLIASHTISINKLLITDKSIIVEHPMERGYDSKSAQQQETLFRKQFSLSELIIFRIIRGYIHSREQKTT